MPSAYFTVLSLATTMLVAACGGDGNGPPGDVTAVAKTSAASGDAQSGIVGQVLPEPLQVVVTTNGAAAPGITVNWATAQGGGILSPASVATNADGVASASWTLGTNTGPKTATATVAGATGSPVTFSASASAAAAAVLEEAGGNGQTGEINTALAGPLQARVKDEFGNSVAGVAVEWAATGATPSTVTALSDDDGISHVVVTLGGAAGPVTITAASDGLQGSPVTFTATAAEPAAIPTTADVTVRDNNFLSVRNMTSNPAMDTVAVGGSVTWTWAPTSGASHNVTSAGTPSFPGRPTAIQPPPYSHTFTAAGTYKYYCTLHGSPVSGMRGQIVVR
jgi:plastocyanin